MKIKYILIIAITAIVTIILVQNNEQMDIQILWMELKISKLIALGAAFTFGLIVGLLWAARFKQGEFQGSEEGETLSDEDREFLDKQ